MLKIKKRTKKVISILGIISLFFIDVFPVGVSALTIPDSLVSSLTQGSTADIVLNSKENSSGGLTKKQSGPQVDVTFSGASQQGSKITATAIPSFFNNASNPKDLYFTWYLKRQACDKTKTVSGSNKSCDLDGNNEIDENDWKVAAAQIIIKGSFDQNGANYTASIDENLAGYKATPSPIGDWSINSGADSNDKDASNCYIQEPQSGIIYEMRRVNSIYNSCPDDAAGNKYHRACVSDQVASCKVLNPTYNQAVVTAWTNNVAAIAAANVWNADPANVADQHVVPVAIPEPIKTILNDFGACAVANEADDNFKCEIADLENFKTAQACNKEGEIPLCVRDNGYTKFPINAEDVATNPLLGIVFGSNVISVNPANNNQVCSSLAKPNIFEDIRAAQPNFLDNSQLAISASNVTCSSVKEKLTKGTKDSAGNTVLAGSAGFDPTCGFEKSVNMCKHLFPKIPKNIGVTGDGKFAIAEKQFWGGDPATATTNGTNKDEESVVGLGIDSFSWMFSPGDQVGVAVEGDSAFPTGHSDSSYKRMWAFSNNTCKKLEDLDKASNILDGGDNKNKRGFYTEKDGTLVTGFLTAEFDLNDCLEENLLDPDGSVASELTVQLNASPANPINDSNGRGDILNIVSTAVNTQDSSGLLYKWSVQKSRDGSGAPIDTTSWMDITNTMESNGSFAASDIQGLNKKDLAINLNLPEAAVAAGMNAGTYDGGAFYLRIKVKIVGSAADGSQDATGMLIVRINQQGNEMLVYPVTAANDGTLSLNKGSASSSFELCGNQQGKTACYVTKNQIVGLEVPNASGADGLSNFSWTVNGVSASCDATISSQCSPGGNKLFVPILGNIGEAVDIVAKATNSKNESIEVRRHFIIGEAGLRIQSLDPNSFCGLQCLDNSTACPKYLGYYKDVNGAQYPDCSLQVWETNSGKTVTLGASGQMGFDWAIDGQIIPEYKDQGQIQLSIDKMAGESYNIGLSTHLLPENKIQMSNMRRALQNNWGIISEEELAEENQSANIQLDVVSGSAQVVASSKSNFFGASLITHLPEQLMFILKISLTSVLLLLATGLLFAFMPGALIREEE